MIDSSPAAWLSWRPSRGRTSRAPRRTSSSSQTGIGTTMFGSSWATSSAALVAKLAADRHAGDVDRADLAELLLGEEVGDVAQVDDVDAVELDDEGDVPSALGAALVVAEGADPVEQDVLDLVLARAVEDERLLQAGREVCRAVARRSALGRGAGRRRDG